MDFPISSFGIQRKCNKSYYLLPSFESFYFHRYVSVNVSSPVPTTLFCNNIRSLVGTDCCYNLRNQCNPSGSVSFSMQMCLSWCLSSKGYFLLPGFLGKQNVRIYGITTASFFLHYCSFIKGYNVRCEG